MRYLFFVKTIHRKITVDLYLTIKDGSYAKKLYLKNIILKGAETLRLLRLFKQLQ